MIAVAYDLPSKRDRKAWAVFRVRELLDGGVDEETGERWNQSTLAKALGVTKGQVWHITQSTLETPRGPGDDTYAGLCRVLKIKDFDKAVRDWRTGHPDTAPRAEPRVVKDDRYPNFTIAAQYARAEGHDPKAIDQVRERGLKGDDLAPSVWVAKIVSAESELLHGERVPGVPLSQADADATRPGLHRVPEHLRKKPTK